MNKIPLTNKQAEEIAQLADSDYVKLARKERRLKYQERQYLYSLRNLEKRGRQLAAEGVTMENLERQIAELEFNTENLEENDLQ